MIHEWTKRHRHWPVALQRKMLEQKLRGLDRLVAERMQRMVPLASSLGENEDERKVIAMLLDEFYQESLHAPPDLPPERVVRAGLRFGPGSAGSGAVELALRSRRDPTGSTGATGGGSGVSVEALDTARLAPAVAWRAKVGSGFSGVAVAGGKAITMFEDGDQYVAAFDAATGEELWRRRIGGSFPGRDGSWNGNSTFRGQPSCRTKTR